MHEEGGATEGKRMKNGLLKVTKAKCREEGGEARFHACAGGAGASRLALVAGKAATHKGVRAQVAATPGWVLESYYSREEVLQTIAKAPPHMLLVEQELPEGRGIVWARQFNARFPEMPVVILAAKGCPKSCCGRYWPGRWGMW